jgi:hypothetical protein
MGQQLFRSKKLNCVRQLRVQLKRRFIHPYGMNREHERLPEGLKYIDTQATRLGSPRFDARSNSWRNSISFPGSGSNRTRK